MLQSTAPSQGSAQRTVLHGSGRLWLVQGAEDESKFPGELLSQPQAAAAHCRQTDHANVQMFAFQHTQICVGHTGEAPGKVKAVAIDSDVGAQPVQPLTDALPHEPLGMVHVGGSVEEVPRAGVSLPLEGVVIPTDRLGIPIQPAAELHITSQHHHSRWPCYHGVARPMQRRATAESVS